MDILFGYHTIENHLLGSTTVLSDPLSYVVEKVKGSQRKTARNAMAAEVPKDNTAQILRAYGLISGKKTTADPLGQGAFSFDPKKKKRAASKKKETY